MTAKKRASSKVSEPAPAAYLESAPVVQLGAGAFKDTCLQLLDQVNARELEVVVTKHGQPVARLVPPDAELPSAFGFLRGTITIVGDIVEPDFEAWGDLG